MKKGDRKIVIRTKTVDRCYKCRKFTTLEGARKFAKKWIGEQVDCSAYRATSTYGSLRAEIEGATFYEIYDDPKDKASGFWDRHQWVTVNGVDRIATIGDADSPPELL